MSETLTTLGLLGALVAGALAWYHRTRARQLTERAEAAEAAVASLKSVNTELRGAIERTLRAMAAQNDREARDDQARAAGADARAAVELLRSLHQDRPSPGGGSGTRVPAPIVPGLPARRG